MEKNSWLFDLLKWALPSGAIVIATTIVDCNSRLRDEKLAEFKSFDKFVDLLVAKERGRERKELATHRMSSCGAPLGRRRGV